MLIGVLFNTNVYAIDPPVTEPPRPSSTNLPIVEKI